MLARVTRDEVSNGAFPFGHVREIGIAGQRVRALRASRDATAWEKAIAGVAEAARGGGNVMPAIIAAVEARATVGEISDAMRRVFGEHEETTTI